MLGVVGGFILIRDGVLKSNDPRLALSQAPERVEGEEQGKTWDPQVLQPIC
jgi:hypothetical protein